MNGVCRAARAPLLALALVLPALAQARAVPALTGPVIDEAGLLSGGERDRLGALARAAWAQAPDHRAQLQFLVVKSLEGDSIEDFAERAFQTYQLGEKGKDNGVLLVVAQEDRRVRIETGYGTEGALTDAQSGRIIRTTLAPAFRAGRYGEGLYAAGVSILSALGALPQGVAARQAARPAPQMRLSTLLIIGIVLVVLFLRVFAAGFGPRRRRFFGGPFGGFGGPFGGFGGPFGGGWGGGGFGGGGGGGGGWGGGGGSSGGGGASGSW